MSRTGPAHLHHQKGHIVNKEQQVAPNGAYERLCVHVPTKTLRKAMAALYAAEGYVHHVTLELFAFLYKGLRKIPVETLTPIIQKAIDAGALNEWAEREPYWQFALTDTQLSAVANLETVKHDWPRLCRLYKASKKEVPKEIVTACFEYLLAHEEDYEKHILSLQEMCARLRRWDCALRIVQWRRSSPDKRFFLSGDITHEFLRAMCAEKAKHEEVDESLSNAIGECIAQWGDPMALELFYSATEEVVWDCPQVVDAKTWGSALRKKVPAALLQTCFLKQWERKDEPFVLDQHAALACLYALPDWESTDDYIESIRELDPFYRSQKVEVTRRVAAGLLPASFLSP